LPQLPFPVDPLVPAGSLEFDPVTRQLWNFYYWQCQVTCPPTPDPVTIDPLTGVWSHVDLPGFSNPLEQDFDIHPLTRELRYFGWNGANLRYSLDDLQPITDTPLSPSVGVRAVAHRQVGSGVETFVIGGVSSPSLGDPWYYLARVGGPGGDPPASSGEVEVIGPIELYAERLWFDISADGTAYLAVLPYDEFVNRLYRVDLGSGALEEIGEIVPPDDDNYYFLAGIAVAPHALGGEVLAVPALTPFDGGTCAMRASPRRTGVDLNRYQPLVLNSTKSQPSKSASAARRIPISSSQASRC
jgi:hypothetical protein